MAGLVTITLLITSTFLAAPQPSTAQKTAPSLDEQVALTFEAVAFWNRAAPDDTQPFALPADRLLRQLADPADTPGSVVAVFADQHVLHTPVRLDIEGPSGLALLAAEYRAAFPDLHLAVVEVIAEEDAVAIRWRSSGTHCGKFLGIAATGAKVIWEGLAQFQVAEGKVAETWFYPDNLSLRQQLHANQISSALDAAGFQSAGVTDLSVPSCDMRIERSRDHN